MSDYLTTKELAALLRIKERKVYDLAASGAVPCSKAMGKLLFPRDAVHAWLAQNGAGPDLPSPKPLPNVFLGSHDPLLDWALRESRCGIATYLDGSIDGLSRFWRREGLATGLHLYDPRTDDWNLPHIVETGGTRPVVLIQWATRKRGLIVSNSLKASVKSISDLKGLRVASRQAESGAQRLLLHLMASAELRIDDLNLTAPVRTEHDAALLVLENKADVSFGLAALAAQYRLPFVPIIDERFDLLIDRRAWFEPPMQKFLDLCHADRFTTRAKEFDGYNLSSFGHVIFNGP